MKLQVLKAIHLNKLNSIFTVFLIFTACAICWAQTEVKPESSMQKSRGLHSNGTLKSNEIAPIFKIAGEDYRQGRYDDAAVNYLKIYRSGISNHILFYNLGNCYFKLNKIGLAILMWEKGLKLKPHDDLLKSNLEFASKRLYDKFENQETHFIGAVLGAVSRTFNVNGWVIISIIFFWAAGISLLIVQKTQKSALRRISGYSAALFILLFVISAVFMIAGFYSLKYDKEGVFLVPAVQVRSGPGTNNPILFILHEGTKVKIEGEQPNWLHVSLPNGYNGWVLSRTVGII